MMAMGAADMGPAGTAEQRVIRVSAVVLLRPDGAALAVRKAGTRMFMFPGGKPEPGESPLDTAVREVAEETGIRLRPQELVSLGVQEAAAANEAGFRVVADVFALSRPLARFEVPEAADEIHELTWLDPAAPQAPDGHGLAPLLCSVLEGIAEDPLF
jgi:8-oxo-dGTP diphosphatase